MIQIVVLVGNRECNTERGFKNQLYIELGVHCIVHVGILVKLHTRGQNMYIAIYCNYLCGTA